MVGILKSPEMSLEDKAIWLEGALKQAKAHIAACLESHTRCSSQPANKLPVRVIDVGPSDGSKDPYLLVSEDQMNLKEDEAGSSPPDENDQMKDLENSMSTMKLNKEEDLKYTTLSYCWGQCQTFVTTLENIEAMKKMIPWDKLPRTIQDAILITRGLGIQYIWIDALCIIQDSPSDWAAESVKMAEIYGGAFVTISAALGPDVHYGLTKCQVSQGLQVPRFELQKNPLYSRAWSLQERMLSPRVLIFGIEGLYWECYQHGNSSRIMYRLPENPSPQDWHIIVEDYTCRNLTNERDKLPALAGLAKLYGQMNLQDYICGLWKQTLILDLMWAQHWVLLGNPAIINPPTIYRAPSWSWASVNGNCTFRDQYRRGDFKQRTEVLAVFSDSISGPLEKPMESDEWILLRGPLLRMKVKAGNMPFVGSYCTVFLDVRELDDADYSTATMDSHVEASSEWRSDTWCLLLGSDDAGSYGLVLVEAVEYGEGNFRRVGYFDAYNWEDRFKDCGESDLMLI